MLLQWWNKADRSGIQSTYISDDKQAQNYNWTDVTHMYNVYIDAHLNLCTLDSSRMVPMFNLRESHCMLLFTTIHKLQNVITMTGVWYYISSQNLLFTCQCQLHVCWKLQLIQPFYNFWLTTNMIFSICRPIQTLCTYQISYTYT